MGGSLSSQRYIFEWLSFRLAFITKHNRYKELSDYDKRLAFDIEKYVNHRLFLKKDEPVEVTEIEVLDEDL